MPLQQTIKSIWLDFKSASLKSLSLAYPGDGTDHINKTLNGSTEDYATDEGKRFMEDPITLTAGFLGLPNRRLRKNEGQSWKNIGLNFIGWQEDASIARLILNAALLIPLNLITTPLRLLLNIVKIGTEVVPAALAIFALGLGGGLRGDAYVDFKSMREDKNLKPWMKFLLGGLYIGVMVLGVAVSVLGFGFSMIHGIGCYITSPISSVRSAWAMGNRGGGIIGGLVLSSLAILGIFSVYAVGLPLLAQAATPLVPFIVDHLPEAALTVINAVAIATLPALNAIGNAIMPLAKFSARALTFGLIDLAPVLTSMPPIVALGAIFGSMMALIGPPVSRCISNFKEKWHHSNTPRASAAAAVDASNTNNANSAANTASVTRILRTSSTNNVVALPGADAAAKSMTALPASPSDVKAAATSNVVEFKRSASRTDLSADVKKGSQSNLFKPVPGPETQQQSEVVKEEAKETASPGPARNSSS